MTAGGSRRGRDYRRQTFRCAAIPRDTSQRDDAVFLPFARQVEAPSRAQTRNAVHGVSRLENTTRAADRLCPAVLDDVDGLDRRYGGAGGGWPPRGRRTAAPVVRMRRRTLRCRAARAARV